MRPSLTTPRPCIHGQRATDRSRNTGEKFRRPKEPSRALLSQSSTRDPGVGMDDGVGHSLKTPKAQMQRNHDATDATVPNEAIASKSKPIHRHVERKIGKKLSEFV
jgi:hypothetical protein